jgi:hypothetical protein
MGGRKLNPFIVPFIENLNKMTVYADNQTYDTPRKERGRYQYVQRSLCCAIEDAPGKDRNERRSTCGSERHFPDNPVQLGIRDLQSRNRRPSYSNCGSPRSQTSDTVSRTVIPSKGQISENLEKFSNFSTLEIPELNDFTERIFNYFPANGIFPLDIVPQAGYNTRIKSTELFFGSIAPNQNPFSTGFLLRASDTASSGNRSFLTP